MNSPMDYLMRTPLLLSAALLCVAGNVHAADDFPNGPISLMVPFTAGGPMDFVARQLASSMSASLKDTRIVVENAGGAGGTIGSARVARARPDGYSLLLNHIGMATAPTLYPDLKFHPQRDFEPVGIVADVPMVLVVGAGSRVRDMETLRIDMAAGRSLNWATAGAGSASDLCTTLIASTMHVPVTPVAYKGTGPAMVDLLGGQVDVMCDLMTSAKPQIDAGKVRALALTSAARLDAAPAIPTLAEAGLRMPSVSVWYGVFAPKGTPAPVVKALEGAIAQAVERPDYRQAFQAFGATTPTAAKSGGAALAERLDSDLKLWGALLANTPKP
jgi:tripartite-type tricarboxylate transporter receptor subunit TctC